MARLSLSDLLGKSMPKNYPELFNLLYNSTILESRPFYKQHSPVRDQQWTVSCSRAVQRCLSGILVGAIGLIVLKTQSSQLHVQKIGTRVSRFSKLGLKKLGQHTENMQLNTKIPSRRPGFMIERRLATDEAVARLIGKAWRWHRCFGLMHDAAS